MGFDKRTYSSRFALQDESIEGILDLANLLKAAIGAAAANWRLVRVLPVRAPRSEGRLLLDSMLREVDFLGQPFLPVIKVM